MLEVAGDLRRAPAEFENPVVVARVISKSDEHEVRGRFKIPNVINP